MFQVRKMGVEDYPFAIELANTMNWNMSQQDFEFIASIEQEGCFVLVKDAERVGMVTCISYGTVGWFGNLVVKSEERDKGAGSLLVKHVIDYFHSKDVKNIGLYAYPHMAKFYNNFGFKKYEQFAVMQASPSKSFDDNLHNISEQDIDMVAAFDKCCFGWERSKLLKAIYQVKDNFGYSFSLQGKIVGYVMAKVYRNMAEIGPFVCMPDHLDIAKRLLGCVLKKLGGISVYLCLPKNETALVSMLLTLGFTEKFYVVRMFLGEVKVKNCIYLAESLERG